MTKKDSGWTNQELIKHWTNWQELDKPRTCPSRRPLDRRKEYFCPWILGNRMKSKNLIYGWILEKRESRKKKKCWCVFLLGVMNFSPGLPDVLKEWFRAPALPASWDDQALLASLTERLITALLSDR